jgi:hypothetical protein
MALFMLKYMDDATERSLMRTYTHERLDSFSESVSVYEVTTYKIVSDPRKPFRAVFLDRTMKICRNEEAEPCDQYFCKELPNEA